MIRWNQTLSCVHFYRTTVILVWNSSSALYSSHPASTEKWRCLAGNSAKVSLVGYVFVSCTFYICQQRNLQKITWFLCYLVLYQSIGRQITSSIHYTSEKSHYIRNLGGFPLQLAWAVTQSAYKILPHYVYFKLTIIDAGWMTKTKAFKHILILLWRIKHKPSSVWYLIELPWTLLKKSSVFFCC